MGSQSYTSATDRTSFQSIPEPAMPHSSLAEAAPSGYLSIHLAPATSRTTVTTTTTTTVTFEPLLVPRPPSPHTLDDDDPQARALAGPSKLPNSLANVKGTSLLNIGDVQLLNPKLYPLAKATLPDEWLEFGFPCSIGQEHHLSRIMPSHASFCITPSSPVHDEEERVLKWKGKRKTLPRKATVEADVLRSQMKDRTSQQASVPHGAAETSGSFNTRPLESDHQTPPRKRLRVESVTEMSEVQRAFTESAGAATATSSASSQHRSIPYSNAQTVATFPLSPRQSPSVRISVDNPLARVSNAPASPADSQAELPGDSTVTTQTNAQNISHPAGGPHGSSEISALVMLPSIMREFGALPPNLQQYSLFQFLRLSPVPVLQYVQTLVASALRRDFLSELPLELAILVLSHVDGRALCRATMVCKTWRKIIDGEARVWKDRLVQEKLWNGDGSEENQAIRAVREECGDPDLRSDFVRRWEAGVWEQPGRDHFPLAKTVSPESMKDWIWGPLDPLLDRMVEHGPSNHRGSWKPGSRVRYGASNKVEDCDGVFDEAPGKPASPASVHGEWPDEDLITYDGLTRRGHFTHKFKYLYRKRFYTRRNWRFGQPQRVNFPGHGPRVVTCLQFDREKIISACDDHSISMFDTQTGERIKSFDKHEGGVWALQYLGNSLVTGSVDRTVRVWNIASGENTHTFIAHTSTVRCLQIVEPINVNPDKDAPPIWEPAFPLIVTGSRDWSLRVWKMPSPNDAPFRPNHVQTYDEGLTLAEPKNNPFHMHLLEGHQQAVRALSAHGKTMVSGSYDFTVRVWDIVAGVCKHVMHGHTGKVYSVVLDPIRQRCASGSMDHTVRLWDIVTGQALQVLDGHTSLVGLLGLSHRNLVSAAADSTLRIWDPDTGACRHQLIAHAGAITCFQHDNQKIISGSDGTMKMWDVEESGSGRDLLTGLTGIWQVDFDDRYCVAAVSRNDVSEFEILDFGRTDGRTDEEAEEVEARYVAKTGGDISIDQNGVLSPFDSNFTLNYSGKYGLTSHMFPPASESKVKQGLIQEEHDAFVTAEEGGGVIGPQIHSSDEEMEDAVIEPEQ